MSAALALGRAPKGLPLGPRLRLVGGVDAPDPPGDLRFRVRPASTPLDGIPWVEARALADLKAALDFDAQGEHTQKEIADRLGLCQQRVDQIEKRALRKMLALTSEDWADDEPATMHKALGSPFATNGQMGTLTREVRR